MGFSRHEWPLHCCICFEGLTEETCVIDTDDTLWDVCKGQCAVDCGIEERTDDGEAN